jgi:hypothetical protein
MPGDEWQLKRSRKAGEVKENLTKPVCGLSVPGTGNGLGVRVPCRS